MRIAWIDHELKDYQRELRSLIFQKEYGLEVISESSWDKFERLHGPIESYDGLLIHPGRPNQKRCVEKVRGLKIPVAIGTDSPNDYNRGEIPVLSYEHPDKIVEFFLQRQNGEGTK